MTMTNAPNNKRTKNAPSIAQMEDFRHENDDKQVQYINNSDMATKTKATNETTKTAPSLAQMDDFGSLGGNDDPPLQSMQRKISLGLDGKRPYRQKDSETTSTLDLKRPYRQKDSRNTQSMNSETTSTLDFKRPYHQKDAKAKKAPLNSHRSSRIREKAASNRDLSNRETRTTRIKRKSPKQRQRLRDELLLPEVESQHAPYKTRTSPSYGRAAQNPGVSFIIESDSEARESLSRNRRVRTMSSNQLSTDTTYDSGTEDGGVEELPNNQMLVQAHVVTQESDPKICVTATPDPWWRRHQWWLASVASLLIMGIAMVVVFTTVDLGGSEEVPPATMAPSSLFEGVEDQTIDLITSKLPSSRPLLYDSSTHQYKALQWVVQRMLVDSEERYSNTLVLQLYSLATLYFSTNGDSTDLDESTWVRSDNWLSAMSPCTWYGVDCAISFRSDLEEQSIIIVSLKLPSNGLNGTLPSEISMLSRPLQELNLSDNMLTGTLPEEISHMISLTGLFLSGNEFQGSIPASIGDMSNLTSLDISMNNLGSTFPLSLGSLSMLEELRLQDNDMIGEVPSTIGLLSKLHHFDVSENRLSFSLPSELGQLLGLKTMTAHGNSLLGPLPSEIGLLRSIETLDLSENFIFDTIPNEILSLSNLRSLDFAHNLFTGTVPTGIDAYPGSTSSEVVPQFDQLTSLRIQDNFLRGIVPKWVEEAKSLIEVDVSSNFFEDELSSKIWYLPKLEHFNASRNDLRGSVLDFSNDITFLSGNTDLLSLNETIAPSLTSLDLASNQFDSTISTDIASMKQLVSMNISQNSISGSLPSELWSLTKLQSVDLRHNTLTVTEFEQVIELSDLKLLRLTGNTLSESLPSQLGLLTSLESLWLDASDIPGSLPSELGFLVKLTDLFVNHNFFTGTIPSQIGYLSNLVALDLSRNALTGSIPTEVGFLTLLDDARLGQNMLSSFLPSEVGLLSNLQMLEMQNNLLTGSVPTEIGQLIRLEKVKIDRNKFSSSLPYEIGLLTKLTSLGVSQNFLSGSLPKEIGLLQQLRHLTISRNTMLTGVLPSEICLLSKLRTLEASEIFGLGGTLPSEIGFLSSLSRMNLDGCSLTGSLPSEVGGLTSLTSFRAIGNKLTGSLPSEMAQMTRLGELRLSRNSISGTIPTEFAMLVTLKELHMDISGTYITGSVPDAFCAEGHHAFSFDIDCDTVVCECCDCPTQSPSSSPSVPSPSAAPSYSIAPTGSLEPSISPSGSLQPSSSLSPSDAPLVCHEFVSIASNRSRLSISGRNDTSEIIDLPFIFKWRGEVDYSKVTVTTNGVIFPGMYVPSGNTPSDGISSPLVLGGTYTVPRIAVAHFDLADGDIYAARLNDGSGAFVISWEAISQSGQYQKRFSFQVLLNENGSIEMRWGVGSEPLADIHFVAGLEDDAVSLITPATGPPFENLYGISSVWPENQCRRFDVVGGIYVEKSDG